jgi:hypothetical protein
MRRTLVLLAACALVAPVAAQDSGTKSTTGSTVTPNTTTNTVVRTRRGEVIVVQGMPMPGTMTMTTTVNGVTKTMTMEPVYNSRGRMMGYREVTSPTTVTKTETKTTENPVKQTGNVEKVETKTTVTTTPTTEPMPERRGILGRIFRR